MARATLLRKKRRAVFNDILLAGAAGITSRYTRKYRKKMKKGVFKTVRSSFRTAGKTISSNAVRVQKWFRKKYKAIRKSEWFKDIKKGRFFSKRYKRLNKWYQKQFVKPVTTSYNQTVKWLNKTYPVAKKSYGGFQYVLSKVA